MRNTEIMITPAIQVNTALERSKIFIIHFLSLLTILIWIGCTAQQDKHDHEQQETASASFPASGISLDHNLVCMVNNTYMGIDQIPIAVENKTYYGCCDNCVKTINTDESARLAIDPFSKVKVDKATAIITMNPEKKGAVLYFESEQNAREFLKN